MKNQHIYNTVKMVLSKEPETRDNDQLLVAEYYRIDMGFDYISMFISEFFKRLSENRIVKPETITRYSRAIKGNHPELRGNNHSQRMAKQEEVKKDQRELKIK